jgi:hypothetical protein
MSVVERFKVRADDGQTYDAVKILPGLPAYQLVSGEHLNVKDERATTFEVVTTGQIVRRVPDDLSRRPA